MKTVPAHHPTGIAILDVPAFAPRLITQRWHLQVPADWVDFESKIVGPKLKKPFLI